MDIKLPYERHIKIQLDRIEKYLKRSSFENFYQERFYHGLKQIFNYANIDAPTNQTTVSLYFFPLYIALIECAPHNSFEWSNAKSKILTCAANVLKLICYCNVEIRDEVRFIPLDIIYNNFLNYFFPDSLYSFLYTLENITAPELIFPHLKRNIQLLKPDVINYYFLTSPGQDEFFERADAKICQCISDKNYLNLFSLANYLQEMYIEIYSLEYKSYEALSKKHSDWDISSLSSRIFWKERINLS